MKMQKKEKKRDFCRKKFWLNTKPIPSEESLGYDILHSSNKNKNTPVSKNNVNKLTCSLPLLQVWPSQDSPKGDLNDQNDIIPKTRDDINSSSSTECNNILLNDNSHTRDSGIDSIQTSPSVNTSSPSSKILTNYSPLTSPNLSASGIIANENVRRKSSTFLHPYHAKLLVMRKQSIQTSLYRNSIEDITDNNQKILNNNNNGLNLYTANSSTTSSQNSVGAFSLEGNHIKRISEPHINPIKIEMDNFNDYGRRRSSGRHSPFDSLDLEYALLRAATRGSVGPYSLSGSIHKLTFTQSLAFPALARGLATKRNRYVTQQTRRPLNPNESGLNTFAKIVTAIVLVMVSFLVFLVVYKFVRT